MAHFDPTASAHSDRTSAHFDETTSLHLNSLSFVQETRYKMMTSIYISEK